MAADLLIWFVNNKVVVIVLHLNVETVDLH